jgi:hypothetical protein
MNSSRVMNWRENNGKFNSLKPSGNYMYRLLQQSVTLHFDGFLMIPTVNKIYFFKLNISKCGKHSQNLIYS